MIEGADTETQKAQMSNKLSVVGKKKSSGKSSAAEKSSIRGQEDESEAIRGLEKDPDAVERISSTNSEALVNKIAVFYDCPETAIKEGLKSKMFILNERGFNKTVEIYLRKLLKRVGVGEEELIRENSDRAMIEIALGRTVAKKNKGIDEVNQETIGDIRKRVGNMDGICIPQEEGSLILIKRNPEKIDEEEAKTHELLHTMPKRRNGTGGGFKSEAGINKNIDEAATQILALALKYPKLTVEELSEKILISKEIKSAYKLYVARLLTIMYATSKSKEPFAVKDLSSCYFYRGKGESVHLMRVQLIRRVREDLRGRAQKWLLNDLGN